MRSLILIGIAILLLVGAVQAGDWPMFGHDAAHTGTTDEIVEPPLELMWKYPTGYAIDSSPVVSGGTVFVGSYDMYVYALDASTGNLKWKYQTDGSIQSSPAVSGGAVYVGSWPMYALDINTGNLKWQKSCGTTSPVVSEDVVYAGCVEYEEVIGQAPSDDVSVAIVYEGYWIRRVYFLYALDASTGNLKWKYPAGYISSSPAVSDGVVYLLSSDYYIYALDASTSNLKWKYKTDSGLNTPSSHVVSAPVVSGGVLYVTSADGYVNALDINTGNLQWKYQTDGGNSFPVVSGGVVYVGGSWDGYFYALEASTGNLKWKQWAGGVGSSSVISGEVVYVGSLDGYVYTFDINTGGLRWNYKTGDSIYSSSPAISEGTLYIGSRDGNLYAFKSSKLAPWTNVGSKVLTDGETTVGEPWDIGNGWTLTANSIDATATPRNVWLTLSKDGRKLDDKVLNEGQTYNFNDIFLTKINRIWAGPTSDLVEFTDAVVNLASNPTPTPTTTSSQIMTPVPTETLILQTPEPQDQTNWVRMSPIFLIFLISVIALLLHKLKKLSRIENFLLSIKKGNAIAIGIIIVLLFSIWYTSDSIEAVIFFAILMGIAAGLVLGLEWIIRVCVRAIRDYVTKIGEGFKKPIKGEKAFKFEAEAPPKKSAPIEKPMMLVEKPVLLYTKMEHPQASATEKLAPEGKPSIHMAIKTEIDSKPESRAVSPSESPRKGFSYKKAAILILFLIVVGAIGYTIYQKYSPLAELANCGNNCIDYKKVKVPQYETSVPDIKITEADAEKLIMDIPIIIYNPAMKDTETEKIDFDVSMEGKHLTKGTIPAYQLPAKQNTTILIKDVVIKYEELGDVLQKVAEKHGAEMVGGGEANISMTTDLLIYFPIEFFSINIYTFTIPIQIESEVPVDLLKQNEEAKRQIDEKVRMAIKEVQEKIKGTLPVLTSTEQESASYIVQHSGDYDGKTVTVSGQVIISPNPGNYIMDGNSGIKLEGLSGLSEGFYKLTGIYNAEKNTLTIQNTQKLEGNPASVEEALKLPNPFVAVKVQGLAASPPAFVENKLNSYIAVPGSPIEEIHTYVIYNKEGLYLIVNPHKSPQLNFSEATVTGTLIKTPPDKLQLGKDFLPADFKGIIIANEITQVNPIPATVNEINQNPENYAFRRVVIDGIYVTGSSKLGYGKETAKEDLRIHLGAGLMGDEFLPEDNNKLIMSIDPVYTDWQIRKGKVTGTVIYPTKEIMQYFAQKGIDEVKELKPVLMVESISEDLMSVSIEDLITDLTKNSGQKYNGKVVNITGYALGANVPVKEVAEKVARVFNPGLGEVVKMIPADVNVQGTAIADSPTPVMGQLPLAGLNSELIEKTQLMAGKYNFKVVVTMIDNKPMLFLVQKEKLPFTVPTAMPTQIPTVIPTAIPTLTSLPTPTPTPLATPISTPTIPSTTPTVPGFP